MWMYKLLSSGRYVFLSGFAVYLFLSYFDIFFERKKKGFLFVTGLAVFAMWQFIIPIFVCFPAYGNIAVTIVISFLAAIIAYEGVYWNKLVFVIVFNAIWMLMETLCNYTTLQLFEK